MDDFVQELSVKFGYGEELYSFLKSLIPAMVTYYGEENRETILGALSNCEIHIQAEKENPKDFLNSYFGTNKEWEMPAMAGAFYHNEIFMRDGNVHAKPIVYVKTVFFHKYNSFDFKDDSKLNILIHELCHLVKGYGKVREVDGKIIDSTGLMSDTYTYDAGTGNLVEEGTNNLGIEEAVNEVDTVKILEIMTGRKQKICGYIAAGNAALGLMDKLDISHVIKSSQFNGDDTWKDYLGREVSSSLVDNFDVLVKSMYVSYSDINTPEKIKAIKNRMRTASDNINDLVQNYKAIPEFAGETSPFKI